MKQRRLHWVLENLKQAGIKGDRSSAVLLNKNRTQKFFKNDENVTKKVIKKVMNKLGLSWAKLSSNWDLTFFFL